MTNGLILYEGPSLIDGKPIVAIALASLANRKTGPAVQTYIMRSDIHPVDASKQRLDISVCGDCFHRGDTHKTRSCYVTLGHGPASVWRSYINGGYKHANSRDILRFSGEFIRLGSYGDPAAVPIGVWRNLIKIGGSGHSGYTHNAQYQPEITTLCMVSSDSEREALSAQAAGFKTFRVKLEIDPLLPGEKTCPGSIEAGHASNCNRCKQCTGSSAKRNFAVNVHGLEYLKINFTKRVAS